MRSSKRTGSTSSMIRFLRPPEQDLELGMPNEERNRQRNVNYSRRISVSNQCIIGLFVVFLFLRYPPSTLLLMLALLACISSCLRVFLRSCRHLLANINLTNLRLALLDRDFNEADYEMLLALDDQPSTSNRIGRQLSLSELPLLPPRPYRDRGEVKETTCSICLEDFEKGQLLRHLSCQHVYHEQCIAKWWKQKGKKTTCPICKASLF